MDSLSKHANKCDPLLIFFIRSGCLLVMLLYAFCKTWSVVEWSAFLEYCLLVSLRLLPSHIGVNF